jgi:hypothetical protein
MFLRGTTRRKNGKEHRYWSLVENKRCAGGRIVQRHALYLGEINDRQEAGWQKSIEVFEQGHLAFDSFLSADRLAGILPPVGLMSSYLVTPRA